jgi:hypothetical protein
MEITHIYSFLVYPGKNVDKPEPVKGTEVALIGKLFDTLKSIFEEADKECNIPIIFSVNENEEQKNNNVRNQIIEFIFTPSIETCENLANRLRDYTTKVPGLGLLFFILGKTNEKFKLVISRFPADEGILANTVNESLEIEFIERIFMKNSLSYKSVLYIDQLNRYGMWTGFAIDKQQNYDSEISKYWIKDFLKSDYRTTSKAGTKRFGLSVKEAIKNTKDIELKQELIAMSLLVPRFSGNSVSISNILNSLHLSERSKNLITNQFSQNPRLVDDVFVLDDTEFINTVPKHSVELDTGVLIIAPTENFDSLVDRQLLNREQRRYKISTVGRITNEKFQGK